MEIPERLWRFSTANAQNLLAQRFDLPNEDWMQDWEYMVSDHKRLDEFLAVYEGGELSDDERFRLMEIIMDSFRDSDEFEYHSPRWLHTLALLEKNIDLHIYTVCYWACLGHSEEQLDLAFEAAPDMRAMLNRHAEQFGFPFPESVEEDL